MNEWQERIGVGLPQHVYGRRAGGTNTTPVIGQEGALGGKVVGSHTEHWSGRVDANVSKAEIHWNPNIHASYRRPTHD